MMKISRRFCSYLARAVKSKFFAVFFFALILRALPEFLSGVYPVGFDALAGYVPSVMALPDNTPMKLFGWAYSPLAIYLLWFVRAMTGVDAYLLLKIAGPVFYGLFTVSFYYMLSRGVGWSSRKSFAVSLLFLFQPAVLRTGWDQLREELGLMFLFVLLGATRLDLIEGVKSKLLLVLALSVLIVFSHQLAAILFFVVAVFQIVSILIQKQRMCWSALVALIPSAFFFVWQLYSQFANPAYSNHFVPLNLPNGTGNFVFTNYFLSDPRFLGGDYWTIMGYVGSLSLYTVIPLIPFAIKGFFRDKVFMPMLIWLGLTSFSIVVFPWFAFSQYWWWILLLPVPLTVYAGHALERLRVFVDAKRWRKTKLGLVILGIVAFGYATSVIPIGYPYAYSYIPPGLVKSSVPFEDIPDIEKAMQWTNQNVAFNVTVIVPEKFQGFAYNELREDLRIRVAPAFMTLVDVAGLTSWKNEDTWAVYNLDEVGSNDNGSVLYLINYGKIGVFKSR